MINKTEIIFHIDGTPFKCQLFSKDASPKPTVMVFPDWSGLNSFAEDSAKMVVNKGYNAIAIDVYGNGTVGSNPDEKAALMGPLKENRELLGQRLQEAYNATAKLAEVDSENISAIGFCFGGLCSLDLARMGIPIKVAASFHGLLDKPKAANKNIHSKILVLHGHDDPMVPPSMVQDFQREMTESSANWQMITYSKTVHSFANPEANAPESGTVYNKDAADNAWRATFQLLEATMK